MQNETTENKKWFVLTSPPKAVKQVSRRLTENGIENYLPLQRQLRTWHDRKKWVEMPLFFSYIFIKAPEKQRNQVFEVEKSLKFVSIGGQICTLTGQEIERMRRLCNSPEPVKVEHQNFESGDEVIITAGHFEGFRGQLIQNGINPHLKISFSGLGCCATVLVNKDYVRKI